jgi:hypothetical protein
VVAPSGRREGCAYAGRIGGEAAEEEGGPQLVAECAVAGEASARAKEGRLHETDWRRHRRGGITESLGAWRTRDRGGTANPAGRGRKPVVSPQRGVGRFLSSRC